MAKSENDHVVIAIFERGVDGVNIIPWTPDKIVFTSGGVKYATYNVMDIGEVKQAIGTNLFSVSWSGRFPGENNKSLPFLKKGWYYDWIDPEYYQSLFSIWKRDKTHLLLMISHTPIFHNVVLSDYEMTYKEGAGDYFYSVEFQEDRTPTFTTTTAEADESDELVREWNVTYDTYTVIDDDTLWGISACYLGDALRWTEIYDLNREVIENEAANRGYSSSDNGHWIFPGTVLKLPGVTVENTAVGEEINLTNAPIYEDSETSTVAARVSGTYYLYDGKNINGRYRITNSASLCGVKPVGLNVTGWLDGEYLS